MLSAVFLVGKLGKLDGDYRQVLVEKVPTGDTPYDPGRENYDIFKVRMWSATPGVLNRLPDGKVVTIKGRLEEKNGEVTIVCELIRG